MPESRQQSLAAAPASPAPGATDSQRLWLGLAILAALVAAAGSIVGLAAARRIYGGETADFADQSAAQDAVNLLVVVPAILILGLRSARGSLRAYVCWLGCLAFTAYSYAIYAFAIHFGPLFLPWVAVLGLSFYALVGSLATVDLAGVKAGFGGRRLPVTGWTLTGFGVLFALLWLSEIVPDLIAGNPSSSAVLLHIPTNPVHVLDLSLFLPAVFTSGILLLRRAALGYATAPGLLVFLVLTCLPILATPLAAIAHGHDPSWGAMAPITAVLLVASTVLARTLASGTPTAVPKGQQCTS